MTDDAVDDMSEDVTAADPCAAETLSVTQRGCYVAPDGARVDIGDLVHLSVERTTLYRDAPAAPAAPELDARTRIEVTAERSDDAARRIIERGALHVGLLNFASSTRPGGGFLHGAQAQEEDLCRCSALYACLASNHDDARAFYQEQRSADDPLALDHVLVSPAVPFFRRHDDARVGQLPYLPQPFLATVLTAAAPDLGWLFAAVDSGLQPRTRFDEVEAVFRRRARSLLHIAADAGVQELVLGAWGCGAFGNDPVLVARAFRAALDQAPKLLARVVFAVWSSNEPSQNRAAFTAAFASWPAG